MELILWRHAEAEDGPNDLERALTRKGQLQGRAMAGWLSRRLGHDYLVLASEARRSRQTAAFLSKGFEVEPALNPGALLEDVMAVIDRLSHGDQTVVLVGHQPYLGRVASRLLAGDPQYWSVKKGAIWWLSLRHQARGEPVRLRAMVTPGLIED